MAKKKDEPQINTGDVGFEKELWRAADALRGNMDASDYKHVVLGLIFLKYISDRFEALHQELVDEGEGFEEDRDAYDAQVVFWVPKEARWDVIANAAHSEDIGVVIDSAMREIERENKTLKGILPKNYASQDLDKTRLGAVVDIFTNINMAGHGEGKDLLGRAYEYCLTNFAAAEGKNGGQFYTPSCVVRTIVEILQPFKGKVYDPCCGSGGMFVQSAKFVGTHGGNINKDISVFGQESNPTTWKMAKMNLAIRGIEADLGEYPKDTFAHDLHDSMKASFIMANPPFNDDWTDTVYADDKRWAFGMPKGNANFAWIQHMIYHMHPTNGRVGFVMANGTLSSQTNNEGVIRRNIVEADLVDCIIAMPSQLFYTVQIPACLWFLSKNKKQKGRTLFIDARKMGSMITRKQREFSDDDIARLAATYDAFAAGTLADEKGYCAVATTEQIASQDFILTPGRYVGIEEATDDGEPFDDKMRRLTSELGELFAKSRELEGAICRNLAAIGYQI